MAARPAFHLLPGASPRGHPRHHKLKLTTLHKALVNDICRLRALGLG
jgi:hypothetical protein